MISSYTPYPARLALYKRLTAMPLDFEAVFSDESPDYLSKDKIKIRLRKGQRAACWLCVSGSKPSLMEKAATAGYFDFYEAGIPADAPLSYYFIIETEWNEVYFYNKAGIRLEHAAGYDFSVMPGFRVPEWAKGCVMYQIFVDRFYNGDPTNDVVNNEYAYLGKAAKRRDWHDPVENTDVCNFYGGDIQGILDKLPYLKDLGIEVLYLNPVFVSPSNHKYDAQDYGHIDPHLGVIKNDGGSHLLFERFKNAYATKYIQRVTDPENLRLSDELMARLIAEAHGNGMKVILDGVFNHCGAFNKWMDREGFYERAGEPAGAYRDKDSPYNGYFRWESDNWPDNGDYDSWWGHSNHPKLNFEGSPELCQYIFEMARRWVSPPFNADGWRLDVAADLGYSREFNIWFWRQFRRTVKEANPNAIILGEHYGDPSDWLTGSEWDTVMNYDAFMEPVTWFLCGMQKHSDMFKPELINDDRAFEQSMAYYMARFPRESLLSAMNQLSNHDHSRFLTRTNKTPGRLHTHGRRAASAGIDKRVMYLAVLMQMTWPGAPCVYYGDEAGLTGWTDPDDRRPYPWGNEDKDMINFHKTVIALRGKSPATRTGSLIYLVMREGLLAYARVLGSDRFITVINNTADEMDLEIPVWKLNVGSDVFNIHIETGGSGFTLPDARVESDNGFLHLTVQGKSGILLS
ncbi:MAG: glycoside hydrolase family 13 protein [Defluviitaleaceae bacterium]|nr:glycoside hydrolase family 13 protein [Defluviitaleaceae bacterium]MCL2837020.1 glycoside hydrolase family 13 protein [Defluviitaleaceae bacterium]